MRYSYAVLLAASLILTGCATQNVKQEAFNRDLIDGTVTMNALQQLDNGETNKLKHTEMFRLEMAVGGLAYYGVDANPDPKVKEAEVTLARQALDYFSVHRKELNPGSPALQGAVKSLQQILTNEDDVLRVKALSDYLENIAQMRSAAPDPQVY